jgi:hypothetical protein
MNHSETYMFFVLQYTQAMSGSKSMGPLLNKARGVLPHLTKLISSGNLTAESAAWDMVHYLLHGDKHRPSWLPEEIS